MTLDPELEKLAKDSRQRLVKEFAETFADLQERARRVPSSEAHDLADKLSCSFQIATVAYLLELDGIMSARNASSLLSLELERRALIGDSVPNLPGNVMEFALQEGRWVHYIYGKFVRELELKVRELANFEASIEEESPPIEKVVSLIYSRSKLAEAFVVPLIEAWMKDHLKSTTEDALMAFGPAITKWKYSTLRGKLLQLRRRNQAFFRRLIAVLKQSGESATSDLILKRIDDLVSSLDAPLDEMTILATSHLILHIAPRPTGRGDRSAYVDVGMASTRGNKADPDLTSPFDFLERDVKLARRRTDEERNEFLSDRISRVLRYLRYQGSSVAEAIERCFIELEDRFKLEGVDVAESVESVKEKLRDAPLDKQNDVAVQIIIDFIEKHNYGG